MNISRILLLVGSAYSACLFDPGYIRTIFGYYIASLNVPYPYQIWGLNCVWLDSRINGECSIICKHPDHDPTRPVYILQIDQCAFQMYYPPEVEPFIDLDSFTAFTGNFASRKLFRIWNCGFDPKNLSDYSVKGVLKVSAKFPPKTPELIELERKGFATLIDYFKHYSFVTQNTGILSISKELSKVCRYRQYLYDLFPPEITGFPLPKGSCDISGPPPEEDPEKLYPD